MNIKTIVIVIIIFVLLFTQVENIEDMEDMENIEGYCYGYGCDRNRNYYGRRGDYRRRYYSSPYYYQLYNPFGFLPCVNSLFGGTQCYW